MIRNRLGRIPGSRLKVSDLQTWIWIWQLWIRKVHHSFWVFVGSGFSEVRNPDPGKPKWPQQFWIHWKIWRSNGILYWAYRYLFSFSFMFFWTAWPGLDPDSIYPDNLKRQKICLRCRSAKIVNIVPTVQPNFYGVRHCCEGSREAWFWRCTALLCRILWNLILTGCGIVAQDPVKPNFNGVRHCCAGSREA